MREDRKQTYRKYSVCQVEIPRWIPSRNIQIEEGHRKTWRGRTDSSSHLLYIHLAYTTGFLQPPEQQTPWFAVSTPSVLCLLVWWSGDLFTAVTSAWRVLSKPGKRLLHLILWCGSMFLVQGTAARPVVLVKGVWGDGVGEETAGSTKSLWVRLRPMAFPLCELVSHGQAWSRGVIWSDWCSNRYLCARPWEGTVASLKRPLKDSRSEMVAWTCVRTEEVVTCAE